MKLTFHESDLTKVLVEGSPDALIALAPDGEILYWNRGAESVFGFNRAEAVGRRLETLIVPLELAEESRRVMSEVLERGAAVVATVRRRKDGTLVEVDVSMRCVRDEAGELKFIAAHKMDVTQLRHMRETRASEMQFRGLLEAAPDAMVIMGRDGRILLVNAQTEVLFGYQRQELMGMPIEVLVPERFRDRHPHHRSKYQDAPRARPMGADLDLFARRRDGTEFAAEISLSPIETPNGTLVTAAIRDVTVRKHDMEEQNRRMQESNRLKSEFLANMSHELRTPLNAIIGFTKLMYNGKIGPLLPDQKEYLGDILTSSSHLLQLINDVLDLAKIESGKMAFHIESVELARVANEVRDILRGLAAERRVRLTLEVDPALPRVQVDPRMLKQVLYNYLSNALKFTDEGGQVVLRITLEGNGYFRVDVRDTGIGIRPEQLARLFVEFQQLDEGASKRYPGTGLGLALTRRIVEAQGGRVEVQSTPGIGSTFSAILPCDTRGGTEPLDPQRSPVAP